VAAACGFGLAAGLAGAAWQSMQWLAWTSRVGDLVSRLEVHRAAIASASTLALDHGAMILLALVACIVLAPLALYITLADE